MREAFAVSAWIAGLVAAAIVVWMVKRRVASSRPIDVGEVSEGWLREHRADKTRD